jgi:hypothetical protein
MRKVCLTALSAAIIGSWSIAAEAAVITNLGVHAGNDDEATVEAIVMAPPINDPDGTDLIGKRDFDDVANLFEDATFNDPPFNSGNTTIVITCDDPADCKTGTFTFTTDIPWELEYFTVKATNAFLLFGIEGYVEGEAIAWSTLGLCAGQRCNQPEVSHLSFFGERTSQVSEPATFALLGAGLLTLGLGMRRRVAA